MKADILHGNSSRNKPSCEPFEPGQSGGAANIELLRLLSSAQIESEWSECTTPTSLD